MSEKSDTKDDGDWADVYRRVEEHETDAGYLASAKLAAEDYRKWKEARTAKAEKK